jgi:hypothetical protein
MMRFARKSLCGVVGMLVGVACTTNCPPATAPAFVPIDPAQIDGRWALFLPDESPRPFCLVFTGGMVTETSINCVAPFGAPASATPAVSDGQRLRFSYANYTSTGTLDRSFEGAFQPDGSLAGTMTETEINAAAGTSQSWTHAFTLRR